MPLNVKFGTKKFSLRPANEEINLLLAKSSKSLRNSLEPRATEQILVSETPEEAQKRELAHQATVNEVRQRLKHLHTESVEELGWREESLG